MHPAELGETLAGWAQTFADYEIMQPFPQIQRPAVTLTEAERAATSLPGFGPVAADRVTGLLRGPWQGNGFNTPMGVGDPAALSEALVELYALSS